VVAQADKSFRSFRKLSVHKRAQILAEIGHTLRKDKAQLAKVISTEMGKIFPEAEAEVEKCAHEADWYAEHGPKIMADEPAPTGAVNAYVSYLPLGPILAIMPWNFPIWQLTRMAIPTMLAGNVVLVKHSPNTQRSSLEFERVILEAGFPEGAPGARQRRHVSVHGRRPYMAFATWLGAAADSSVRMSVTLRPAPPPG